MNSNYTFELLDVLNEGVLVVDHAYNIRFWNKRLEQWSNISRENILGCNIFERFPHLNDASKKQRIQTLMTGGAPIVFSSQLHGYFIPCPLPNDEFRTQQTSASLLKDEDENMIIFCIQDLTEHCIRLKSLNDTMDKLQYKLAEHTKLEQENAHLIAAIDQAGEAVVITDTLGHIQYINQTFSQQTGLSLHDASNNTTWFDAANSKEPSFHQLIKSAAQDNAHWQGVRKIQHQSGHNFSASISMSPIINTDGHITHITIILEDISERLSMEEKHQKIQKNEALTTLISGIAHDFNNILSGILGHVYLTSRAIKDNPKITERMQKIQAGVYEAADIVKQLLSFSRHSQLKTQDFPLNSFLKEWIKLIEHAIPEHTVLHLDFDQKKYPLYADADMLQQSMFNLVRNAWEAMDGIQEGEITIKLRTYDASKHPGFLSLHSDLANQSFAHIIVHDNGKGIEEDHIGRVCDPFFTTKQLGNGLGLAHVSGCVSQHHGFLEIESEPGSTSIHLLLPLHQPNTIPHADTTTDHPLSATILAVDDNLIVQEVCTELLIKLGHQVITASNGKEAIEKFKQHADNIDAIIMDVIMPRMNGIAAAKKIRAIHPNIPIIFSTAYDQNIASSEISKMDHATLISKPFDPDYLQELLIKLIQE